MSEIDAAPPRLRVTGIHKRFGGTVALAGVELTVNRGEVLAVVGENGAGKSTLMKILSGAHRADEGEMWLDGQRYEPRNPLEGRRAGVSMIYQELSLAPHLSVMDNILLGMEPMRGVLVDRAQVRRRAVDALAQLGRPDISPDVAVSRLGIAERQLVEIGRAIAVGCRVLVLDEPTSSLAAVDIQKLFALVERLKQQGHAILYISHFLEEVRQVADRFTVLRDGRTVGGGIAKQTPVRRIISMMVGRDVEDLYPRSARVPGEVLLEVDGLAGERGPRSASLQLRRGEVLGIAGLIGAGRSEMVRAIFGLDRVRSGAVRIGGNVDSASTRQRWNQGVGMVSEDRKAEGLALDLSIADNLTLSRLGGLGPAGWVLPSRQAAAGRRWIANLGVKCRGPRQPIGALSGGNQQKIAIARLLHHDCDVLLLDEPTRGIDVASKAQIYRLIDDLAVGDAAKGRRPRAVLMVSSYLPELLGTCDRIAVMCRGKLNRARPVAEWNEHEIMLEATGANAL
jgi:ribose transport system ATP-binding protein